MYTIGIFSIFTIQGKKLTLYPTTNQSNEQTPVLLEMSNEPQYLEQTIPTNSCASPIASTPSAICDPPIAICDPPEAICDPPELQELFDPPRSDSTQSAKKVLSAKQLTALEHGRKKLAEKRRLIKETLRTKQQRTIPETIPETESEDSEEDSKEERDYYDPKIVRYGFMNWVTCTIV